MHALAGDPADQIDTGGDVAPLVRSPGLQHAVVVAVKLEVVEGLQELITELGIGDAVLGQAGGNRFAIEHAVDAEMLADVAEKLQKRDVFGPVVVIHHAGGVWTIEVVEVFELGADAGYPLVDHLARIQGAFPRHLGVPDQAGCTADEGERSVPVLLEAAHSEDLGEVAEVQARRGGVEAAVDRDGLLRCGPQRVQIGRLGDQLAPREVFDDRAHGAHHGASWHHSPMAHTARTMQLAADHIAAVDPAFIPIINESPLCTIGRKKRTVDPFHALVISVIGQQLSVRAADTITARLHGHLDGRIDAATIVAARPDELRSVGLSGAKVRTITELALAVHAGELDLAAAAKHEDDHQVVAELTRFWGIGRWTAEMFLMFTLHRLDVWPVGDLAMRKGWQQIHRGRAPDIDPTRLDQLGNRFRPYRSVAAWYCWRIIDGETDTW